MKKKIIFKSSYFLSTKWLKITYKIRLFFSTYFFILEPSSTNENNSFRIILTIRDKLELILNERVIKYKSGIHPKYDLIK